MKRWTKHMRKLIKQYRMLEKARMKADGVWIKRGDEPKMCSECDPLDCMCKANERANELIGFYSKSVEV